MHRSSSLIALAISILTAALCVSSTAQERAPTSARTGLAIDIDEGRYRPLEVSSSEGGYLQISPTRKVEQSKERRDGLPVTGIRIRPILEGDGVRAPKSMVWIPGGDFLMGSEHQLARPNERPAHRVRVHGFWMDKTEVTNAQFERFAKATHRRATT